MNATYYAVLVGGANGDGAWRGLGTIVELTYPRPYMFQPAEYGRLIYTVTYIATVYLPKQIQIPICPPHQNCVVCMVLTSHTRANGCVI